MDSEARPPLSQQNALVTGAAQGMGAAIAGRFAAAGLRVMLCDVNVEEADALAKQLDPTGTQVVAQRTDVRSPDDVRRAVDIAADCFGGVHVLVNNAGVLRPTRIGDISPEEWDLVVDVNLKGTFLCSQSVLPIMTRQRFGRIVNMSSSAGRSVSTLGGAHYTAAKAGVLGLSRAIAKEVASLGITVNAVCPGLIDTAMARSNCDPEAIRRYEANFPIHRLGTPEEVADLVFFLATGADYITGASFDINGGDLMI